MMGSQDITDQLRDVLAPAPEPDEPAVSSLRGLLSVLDVVPRNERGLPRMHYRRGDTEHAACGRATRVTSDPARVTCLRCRQYVPPSDDTLSEMAARLDELMKRR
jgi:hypothetical protein